MHDQPTAADPRWHSSGYLRAAYGFLALTLLLFVLTSIILDTALARLPIAAQRGIVVVALILPAALGAIMGMIELTRPRHRTLITLVAIILNALIVLFFSALLAFAG